MPIKRRSAKTRRADISEVVEAILWDEALPDETEENAVEIYFAVHFQERGELVGATIQDYWEDRAAEILDDWINKRPGTRPSCWWKWSSPRWERQPELGEPRQAIGHALEDSRYSQSNFVLGVPQHLKGHPRSIRVESQASYLRRHGLFKPGEEKRLTAADFQPEQIAL